MQTLPKPQEEAMLSLPTLMTRRLPAHWRREACFVSCPHPSPSLNQTALPEGQQHFQVKG